MIRKIKTFFKQTSFTLKKFLRNRRLFRLMSIVYHIEYYLVTRKNFKGFITAISTELIYSVLDIFTQKRVCPICKWQGFEFSPIVFGDNFRPATRCPSCLTCERHRILALYLVNKHIENGNWLMIGPNMVFSKQVLRDYLSIDINFNNNPDITGNITNLPLTNSLFSYVICFRVLEHVSDINNALLELYRVLSNNGKAFISVPLYEGLRETINYSLDKPVSTKGPTSSFPDHKWDFEILDFENRINEAGFFVNRITLHDDRFKTIPHNDLIGKKMGLIYRDIVFECIKP